MQGESERDKRLRERKQQRAHQAVGIPSKAVDPFINGPQAIPNISIPPIKNETPKNRIPTIVSQPIILNNAIPLAQYFK